MDLSSKRILLTGGAGFLGSFVTEKLKAMPVPYQGLCPSNGQSPRLQKCL